MSNTKKKFKDTGVGKFLLEKIPDVVGAIAGDTPVGSVIQAIIGGSDMSDTDKEIALEKLKMERAGWYMNYPLDSITGLLTIVIGGYFGSRGVEKVFGNNKHK
jgi:hypothetical protein